MKKLTAIICIGLVGLVGLVGLNAQSVPLTPPVFPTNQLISAVGASAVAQFALNLLPAWDKGATNMFGPGLELEVSPAWKTATASGSTPYLSVGGSYFFSKLFGAGGDVVSFGNGAGSSTVDSVHVFGLVRKDMGNIAGHFILGAGRDVNLNKFMGELGVGLEYRYATGVGLLVDTRYLVSGSHAADHSFLTRVGVTLHF